MSEEVLIPTMKRLDKKHKKIKIPFLNITLVLLCTLLIVGSNFVNINISHYFFPREGISPSELGDSNYIYTFSIVPQIPVLLFVCSLLGKKLATTCVCLYILGGLTVFPVFALGGGIRYLTEYGFGYIFAFVPAVLVAGNILKNKYTFLNMLFATIASVLIIHFTGIFYMIILTLFKHDGISFIKGWICAQSGLKIIYDMVFGYVCVLIGKYVNLYLKFLSD